MIRTKLSERKLPVYSKGEEIFNMVSHIVGGAFGVAVLVLCVIFSTNTYAVVASAIYGATVIILYTMSSIYHGLKDGTTVKKVFQVIDHCSVFLLIAGTYTPFALCTLREYDATMGWVIFSVIWTLAIIGITLNSIDLKKFRVFSMICYLVMGWCILVRINILPTLLGMKGFILLLSGGIAYTIGTIAYGLGRKTKWMHSVFHVLCIIASVLQFLCIFFYVI